MDNTILKKNYEISLWEDVLIKRQEGESTIPLEGESTVPLEAYYQERKIAIIGSDSMDTPIRAFNPSLNMSIGNISTLTFSILLQYYDQDSQTLRANPFLALLANERKIKLKYNDEWYDFIIKSIQENSTKKEATIIAKDLFVNELSKTGFSLEFGPELKNGQGTVTEIAEQVLEGTDWTVDNTVSEKIQELQSEPLYKVKVKEAFEAKDIERELNTINVNIGDYIYIFHSTLQPPNYDEITGEFLFFQFLFKKLVNGQQEGDQYSKDDDNNIIGVPNYTNTTPNFTLDTYMVETPQYTPDFKGKRLVRKQLSSLDPDINRYVNHYKKIDNGTEITTIRGFYEPDYTLPGLLNNYISNGENISEMGSWSYDDGVEVLPTIFPIYGLDENNSLKNYLEVDFKDTTKALINDSLKKNSLVKGFVKGEKYILRIVYGRLVENALAFSPSTASDVIRGVVYYKKNTTDEKELFNFSGDRDGRIEAQYEDFSSDLNNNLNTGYLTATCQQAISQDQLKDVVLCLYATDSTVNYKCYINTVQFFPYIEKEPETPYLLGDMNLSTFNYYYYYYDANQIPGYKSIDDLLFLEKSKTMSSEYTPIYLEDFQRVRSIQGAESNRFNWLQTLAETFQCWVKFTIDHDSLTGKISTKEFQIKDAEGILIERRLVQCKYVSFHNFMGQENPVGFKYGINLESINRDINSEQIISKLIVKHNSNEFAPNGFAAIAFAESNPGKENFLYNFKHYYQKELLNYSEVMNDLYMTGAEDNYLGYYTKLREKNIYIANFNNLLDSRNTERLRVEGMVSANKIISENAKITADRLKEDYLLYKGIAFTDTIELTEDTDKKIKELVIGIRTALAQHSTFAGYAAQGNNLLDEINDSLTQINTSLSVLNKEKIALHKKFYQKYSRFIQEGSWISEDYIDDNLYYLDAESTLYTSASPQITYTIKALELSKLEGYETYTFKLGDRTYMEDTEFFGWNPHTTIKTPYKEEIIISEITYFLDSPELNEIKVQNFKTRFEDLFQRITATTQAVQFSTGEYGRAANLIDAKGAFKVETLENSFARNAWTLANLGEQSVVWDSTGITITNPMNSDEMVRLVNEGIYLTNDGGTVWTTGITGSGINANQINTGALNTSVITISAKGIPSFRWDVEGLTANGYETVTPEEGEPYRNYELGRFVRFDQHGIYGLANAGNSNEFIVDSDDPLTYIKNNADFGLTWDGFFLRNRYGNGFIEIDSSDDIRVLQREREEDEFTERIKIGRLDSTNDPTYGIKISDALNNPVLETSSNGNLDLRGIISIGPNDTFYSPRVQLGMIEEVFFYAYNEETGQDELQSNSYAKILAVKNFEEQETLAIYDDGRLVANNVFLEGEIIATSGVIGGLTIDELGGFTSAIAGDNPKLIFDENGLTVQKGGLTIESGGITIKNAYEDTVLSADENGDLILSGTIYATDGVFGGRLEAVEGTFAGELTAATGTINSLTAGNVIISYEGIQSVGFDENDSSDGFFIGNNKIVANNITLGESVDVQKYIKLGENTWLFNPNAFNELSETVITDSNVEEEDVFLINEGMIRIKENGIISLGKMASGILLNGNDETIKAASGSWSLNSDTAKFNNIVASGSIVASVLEYAEVQSSAGTIIFRPSSIIEAIGPVDADLNQLSIVLHNRNAFSVGDYCRIDNYYCKIEEIDGEIDGGNEVNDRDQPSQAGTDGIPLNISFIGLENAKPDLTAEIGVLESSFIGKTIINFGQDSASEESSNDLIGIAINSSNNVGIVPAKALTVFEAEIDESRDYPLTLVPRIILGELPEDNSSIKDAGFEGSYGLYAENAYLQGALVAKKRVDDSDDSDTFIAAGIHSASGAIQQDESKFPGATMGNIVFWAGAEGVSQAKIEASKFRVDVNGNLYAGSGYFTGTIITNSDIYASHLYATTIRGWSGESKDINIDQASAALKIEDAEKGIEFNRRQINTVLDDEGNEIVDDKGIPQTEIKSIPVMELTVDQLSLDTDFKIGKHIKAFYSGVKGFSSTTLYIPVIDETKAILIEGDKIGFLNTADGTLAIQKDLQGSIQYNEGISLYSGSSSKEDDLIGRFSKTSSSIESSLRISENFSLANTMEYKQITDATNKIIGYNLYVK